MASNGTARPAHAFRAPPAERFAVARERCVRMATVLRRLPRAPMGNHGMDRAANAFPAQHVAHCAVGKESCVRMVTVSLHLQPALTGNNGMGRNAPARPATRAGHSVVEMGPPVRPGRVSRCPAASPPVSRAPKVRSAARNCVRTRFAVCEPEGAVASPARHGSRWPMAPPVLSLI